MRIKRFSFILVFIMILNTFAAPFAFAKTKPAPNRSLNVVALGDSITFGYPPPSTTAFPDLISGANKVVKFGGSGYTSSQLLEAINSDPKSFKNAVKKADVITINIGSNDLMQETGVAALFAKLQPLVPNLQENLKNGSIAGAISSTPLTPLTKEQLGLYTSNLVKIMAEVKKHTKAPIILYNLYNPIVLGNPALDQLFTPLHTFIEGNLAVVNCSINQVATKNGAYVADAYSTFRANPAAYIIPFDIHPTIAGHNALASLADTILASITNHKKCEHSFR